MVTLDQAGHQIEDSKLATRSYPEQERGNQQIGGLHEHWGSNLRYEPTSDGFIIRSAGPDKQFNTSDDLTTNDQELKRSYDHSNALLPEESVKEEAMENELKSEKEFSQ
jgi:hypothetical protein